MVRAGRASSGTYPAGAPDGCSTQVKRCSSCMRKAGIPWLPLFATELVSWLPWALATPFIVGLARRYSISHGTSARALAVHLTAFATVSVVTETWSAWLQVLFNPWGNRREPTFVDTCTGDGFPRHRYYVVEGLRRFPSDQRVRGRSRLSGSWQRDGRGTMYGLLCMAACRGINQSDAQVFAAYAVGFLPIPVPFLDIYGKAGLATSKLSTDQGGLAASNHSTEFAWGVSDGLNVSAQT